MTDAEINDVVTTILEGRLNQFGFLYSRVSSEPDFDGNPIIRVVAHYKIGGRVPSEKLIGSLEDIRSELIQRGEERFVFIDNEYPGAEVRDEDSE